MGGRMKTKIGDKKNGTEKISETIFKEDED